MAFAFVAPFLTTVLDADFFPFFFFLLVEVLEPDLAAFAFSFAIVSVQVGQYQSNDGISVRGGDKQCI